MDAKLVQRFETPTIIVHRHHRTTTKRHHLPLLIRAVVAKPADNNNNNSNTKTTLSSSSSNVYHDTWFDRLAINHLSHCVKAVTGVRSSKSGYDGLVEITRAVFHNFDSTQQQSLIIQALHKAIPNPILMLVKEAEFNGRREKNVVHIQKCRFLEETNCVGMCTNLCKMPSQTFIKNSMGMPVNMVPNFENMSCEMIFGQDPPSTSHDPAMMQPCYKLCNSKKKHHNNCIT
ncbi:PREDICTED: beta-carotene isomerase D27, chloroplastic isoform X2 [Ipomoea nil]|uniref:beta-carotene isomerase D27, chloroplastic isoform X2 n=1 Tax=Ipomoea nil TaxID=35883 RepID=UPI0009018187|nr:PREDICTED: beta-carotene isomerase D27, chloroplastic isoform X2 [Ipomoea nil]